MNLQLKKKIVLDVSFEDLYRDNFNFVWRSLRGLGVNPALLDDATQEVFMVVNRRLSEYEPTGSVKNWLYAILRRVAKDARRKEKRKGGALLLDETQYTDGQNPHRSAESNEALRIVENFADSLDDERRSIFVLSEIEQMRVPEISDILNINVNTIYSRLKVIREDFQKVVDKTFKGYKGTGHV
jgi:RNA polymerase sigma-70 factor (ECF subfamily)